MTGVQTCALPILLQQLKNNYKNGIYYHKTDKSRLELDFVIQKDAKVLPIEVKAGQNIRANSLTTLLRENPDLKAVRFSMLPYKEQEQITNIPLYGAGEV